jgi:hypothetical protein
MVLEMVQEKATVWARVKVMEMATPWALVKAMEMATAWAKEMAQVKVLLTGPVRVPAREPAMALM